MNQDRSKEHKYLDASMRQLVWWRYKKHSLAMMGLCCICLLYFSAAFCEFLAPYSKDRLNTDAVYACPSKIRIFDEQGRLHRPFVYGLTPEVKATSLQLCYRENKEHRYAIRFLVRGDPYKFWGLCKSRLHLFGADSPGKIFLFGTDRMGRDMFSRCLYGSRISLSIGILGVFLSLVLGLVSGRNFRLQRRLGGHLDSEGH